MTGADRSRTLVLTAVLSAALLTTASAGVGLVLEPDVLGSVVLVGLLAAQATALLRRLPDATPSAQQAVLSVLAALTLLSIPALAPLGVARGWETWAWVGAGLVGSVPLLVNRWAGAAVAVVLVAASAGVGQWADGSPWVYALLTAGTGGALLLIHLVPLGLWRLVTEAQAGRDAAARLAAADERLRFAADVHDLLGHHLTVIALAAELAARTARTDPDAAAGHAERARESAATALAEMRRVVHGYRETDLPAQLDAVAQVLRASGVRTTVDVRDDAADRPVLTTDAAAALAATAREAATNVLRHSRSRWCTIALVRTTSGTELTVANDGAAGDATGAVRDDTADPAPGAAPHCAARAASDGAAPMASDGAASDSPASGETTDRAATGGRAPEPAPDGGATDAATPAAVSGADRYSSGLAGLRDRLAVAGGALHTGLDGTVFTLRATVPS